MRGEKRSISKSVCHSTTLTDYSIISGKATSQPQVWTFVRMFTCKFYTKLKSLQGTV